MYSQEYKCTKDEMQVIIHNIIIVRLSPQKDQYKLKLSTTTHAFSFKIWVSPFLRAKDNKYQEQLKLTNVKIVVTKAAPFRPIKRPKILPPTKPKKGNKITSNNIN